MHRSTLIAWVAGAAVLFAGRCGAAQEASPVVQPPAGTFKMREELKGKHPRLYFTTEEIPEIRRKAKGERKFFLDAAKGAFGGYAGQDVPAKFESWKQYLYGFWGLFAMDMLYLVEEDGRYRDTAKKWALWLTRDRWWVKDDLSAMDALSGLSLTYDLLYDEFTEAERGQIRRSIYEGTKFIAGRFSVGQYWTRDYQNNHMHNRIHGLAHGSFAIYGDDPELDVQKFADLAMSQIEKVIEWLPEDGSQHEGPGYWSFGHHWVARMVKLAEHVTGQKLAERNPNFANTYYYRIYMTAPGWRDTLNIGDAGRGGLDNPTPMCLPIAESGDPHGTAVLQELMRANPKAFYRYPAWGLLWYDGSIKPRPIEELPLWRFWPDLEMLSVRSSWDEGATAFVFKCGPVGGHKMQKLRGGDAWVNVAHDHPDQNHFLLFAHGKMMAEDDDYPHDKKLTRSHNTIVIDGTGQPREGTGWQQPFPYEQTGTMDDVFLSHQSAYAAGNASRCYEGAERFVRHVAFVGGRYVIVLDDLVGAGGKDHEYEWRLHKKGDWKKVAEDHFRVADGDVSLDIRFLSPEADRMKSDFLPAELTAKPCLAVKQTARQAQFLAVLVPHKGANPGISVERLDWTGCTAVRGVGAGAVWEDVFLVPDRVGPFGCDDVRADGAAALVRRDGRGLEFAMLTRGTSLSVGGKVVLAATKAANVSWRKVQGQVLVEAEAAYKAAGGETEITVGGLEPGRELAVLVDGERAKSVRSDAEGTARVGVDLKARRVIQIGGTESVVPIVRPGAGK